MLLPLTLLDLAGSVALLLWGVHMVQTGIQRAFGARLRGFLGLALRTRLRAFFAGIAVTAILQSSTATGLMATGFAAGGLVDLVPALAVMLGANVGTTLIVQVLSFDVAEVAPALILVGLILFRRTTAAPRDFGRVLIGLGLMLMALHQFVSLLTPYEDVPSLRMLLGAVSTEPVLDVILAAGLTWAAHSSVAVVLLVMSFAAKGVVPPDAAFALVLGANLGTAINPIFEGSTGKDPSTRRLPLGNLVTRVVGVGLVLAVLPWIGTWVMRLEPDNARAVADFHTALNLVVAAVFMPLLGPYAALLRRILPARVDAADPARPLYLDPAALESPTVAIGAAAREALRLSDVLDGMLGSVREAIDAPNRKQIADAKARDDVLDKLNIAIKTYLTALDPEALSEEDHRRVDEILIFATNMEQAGDVVDKDLLGLIARKTKRGVLLPKEDRRELIEIVDRLTANTRTAASLFLTADSRAARQLAAEKEAFRALEAAATATHFARLRAGGPDAAELSTLRLDVLHELKEINTHLVASAAYPVLAGKGELLPSRLRQED